MYEKAAAAVCALVIAGLPACAGHGRAYDAAGVTNAKRIVTLMPSFAQDLCAMGDGKRIAGVSQYSRSASCASNAPEVANFASVDVEKIVSLHPDAVVEIPAQARATAALARAGIPVINVRDESYDDIFLDIRELGAVSGDRAGARRLESRLRARTKILQGLEHFTKRPRVFVVLQAQPVWTVGPQSYISTLLQLAGARNAVTALPRAYAQYSAEALIRLNPDAIVTGSDTRLPLLFGREPWRSLRAVRDGRVYILKNPSLLETPGPSYNEGLAWLIERLRSLSR